MKEIPERVLRANDELVAFDHNDRLTCPGYDELSIDSNREGLTFRQHLAEAIFLVGNAAMRGSRAFDNCFENGDGDQVVAHLVARSLENPALRSAIAADFGGIFPSKWIETAGRLSSASGQA